MPSTETTRDLMRFLMPCKHQFHRECILRTAPAPINGVIQPVVCPLCRTPGIVTVIDAIISDAIWQRGDIPECLCGNVHRSRIDYDTCPRRPVQCSKCYDIISLADTVPDDRGIIRHNTQCIEQNGNTCVNEGCGVIMHPGDHGSHEMSCPHRTVKCSFCKTRMKYMYFEEHYRSACRSTSSTCEFCKSMAASMPHINIPSHTAKRPCHLRRIVMETLLNPSIVKGYVATADAASSASMPFLEEGRPEMSKKRKRARDDEEDI